MEETMLKLIKFGHNHHPPGWNCWRKISDVESGL